LGKKITTEQFIIKANQVHGNHYDYSLVDYINNFSKIKIICKEHGIFYQTPKKHMYQGCPKCKGFYKTNDEITKEFKKIHKDIYDYSLVDYKNSKSKVIIICKKHGKYLITPNDHLNGIGCKVCGNISKNQKNKLSSEKFIEKSNKKHNNKYDYSLTNYIDTHTKIKIICKKHGIFEQRPHDHLKGIGCPICKESKSEIIISNILKNKNIYFIQQKTFDDCKGKKNKLPFDFYLPDFNICIEYDGRQHYESIEYFGGDKTLNLIKINDKIKTEYCLKNNIRLIRIRYDQNIENELFI